MVITKTLSPLDHSQTKTNESAETRKPQLLCIDDDPDIAQALEMALSNLEIDLTCAFSGQQGIWNALTNKPDLILTDWLMPNGSGEDLVTTLKRNKNTVDIPIVVLSCLGGGRQEQRLFSMGVDGFVQKPISYATLISEIGRHITLPQIGFASTQPDGNDDE
ncbi:response regulator [Planctomycetes bacterium K23_9]|uniref:Phosphate regulon transcriptional regulatory protein PhoB n=1 Tax=Stieleria marina TaxID=1930275 RepID=A0A517NYE7_9BACT|nr:Phosphate regulon transcriptional regulatory protein PhoB [Planctomycetes bacterium K23_9]